jgi:ribosome-binding protein aMBF1 (putative translation factor)
MQDARAVKQFSQKDVAQKVNEKPSVIQDYESGKAIPDPQILGKLERVLGVKLRGEKCSALDIVLSDQLPQVQKLGNRWRGQRRRNLTSP